MTFQGTLVLTPPTGSPVDVTGAITDISYNWSLDAGAQLSISLMDIDKSMLKNNFFQLKQKFSTIYPTNITWMLTSVDVTQGEGDFINLKLELEDYIFATLKADLKPQVFKASNGYEYAANIARKYNLNFIGEEVKGKQSAIKVKVKNNTDSTWSCLKKAASDNQYQVFLSEGTLFFGSPKFLLGKWGWDKLEVVGKVSAVLKYPTTPVPVVKGNINLNNRPLVKYKGAEVNLRAIITKENKLWVVLPTVMDNRTVVSDETAISKYKITGKHLGKYRSESDARKAVVYLNELQKTVAKEVNKKTKIISYVPLVYPTPKNEQRFLLTGIPEMRKSLDSPKQAEGSVSLWGGGARSLRAGMTVVVKGLSDDFDSEYIITSVDFQENIRNNADFIDEHPEPVKITFASVSKLAPEEKAKVSQKIAETSVIYGNASTTSTTP